jgi:hypothetical protein
VCDGLRQVLEGHWTGCPQCKQVLSEAIQPDVLALSLPCVVGLSLFTDHVDGCESCTAGVREGLRGLLSLLRIEGPTN